MNKKTKALTTEQYKEIIQTMGVTLPWCKGYYNTVLLKPHRGTLALSLRE